MTNITLAPGFGKTGIIIKHGWVFYSADTSNPTSRPGVLSKDVGSKRDRWTVVLNVPDYVVDNITGDDGTTALNRETLLFLREVAPFVSKNPLCSVDAIPGGSATEYETISDAVKNKMLNEKPEPKPQKAVVSRAGTRPEYVRPNGEIYFGRTIGGKPDVEILREAVDQGLIPYLYGDPGCGKTALVEASFGEGLETIIGSADTDESSFVGSWVQDSEGYKWVDGPLIRAMKNGTPIFIDEVGLIDARVISILNPLLDGRGVIDVRQNPTMEPVHAKAGFACLFAGNPNALGVRMSEALVSRLSYPLLVETDFDVLADIGVDEKVVQIVKSLNERKKAGETAWAPQTREALSVTKIWKVFGEQQGVNALVSMCPPYSRNQVTLAIQAFAGLDSDVLQVDA